MSRETTLRHVAAIDAGSNGLRLLIGAVDGSGGVRRVRKEREAVRLGQDVFTTGAFSEESMDATAEAFRKFRRILDEYGVRRPLAVATSATRDAENGEELVRRVRDASGIGIEVIDAMEEARFVLLAVRERVDLRGGAAVLIDMGGGSVEATVVRDGRALGCESYPLGPVRLLRRLQERGLGEADARTLLRPHRSAVAGLIRAELGERTPDLCIGVGGNIERMAKLPGQLLGDAPGGRFTGEDLDALIPRLLAMPIARRIERLGMRADRADVIVPAMMVMRQVIAETGAADVRVPGVGLKEGLLRRAAEGGSPPFGNLNKEWGGENL